MFVSQKDVSFSWVFTYLFFHPPKWLAILFIDATKSENITVFFTDTNISGLHPFLEDF